MIDGGGDDDDGDDDDDDDDDDVVDDDDDDVKDHFACACSLYHVTHDTLYQPLS